MSEYGQQSLWRDTATADTERARDLAARLERRAKAEDEVAARDTYLGLLNISAGERVLDVGCGSGAVTREIARRVGSTGLVVGLDPSPALLAVARGLAQESGLGGHVEFREGDGLRLPFPDRSFDAAVCVTVLSHVPKGEAAIPELVRVLRSGGRLGVFDLDTDMTAFTHPDRSLTRRIVAAASDATAVNGWLVRQLPLLFRRAGLIDVRARLLSARDPTAELLCQHGRPLRRGGCQGRRSYRVRRPRLAAGVPRSGGSRTYRRRPSAYLRLGPKAGMRVIAMDWTMVNNAEDATQRIQAIFYLSRFRYEVDARTAGERLAEGSSDNPLCKQTIAELRAELTSPSIGLGMVRLSDAEVRVYLSSLLEAFDERVTSMRRTGE